MIKDETIAAIRARQAQRRASEALIADLNRRLSAGETVDVSQAMAGAPVPPPAIDDVDALLTLIDSIAAEAGAPIIAGDVPAAATGNESPPAESAAPEPQHFMAQTLSQD
jgi:hypothetical protein